ncbi:MAG: histidinol-phosphatase [Candidatus Hydrogenedentes bacterium]|nr:histidinol-phosphatase [Candidatus Hydrogenedentota bacterium]
MNRNTAPWKVSLHGGHCGEFCDHAVGTLREVLDAAIAQGFATYGVSEHVPRHGDQYLYENELSLGWTVDKIAADFEAYGKAIADAADEYSDRLIVLRGYEIEIVPHDRYVSIMLDYRKRFGFDYMVGSVHFYKDILIDGPMNHFERAVETAGGLEALALRYYESVAEMVQALRPEVVGHLDLIRKNGHLLGPVETPAIRRAAESTLEVIRECGGILDLNTAGWRKGLDSPYPAPWLVEKAHSMGVPFCFGDDSHGPDLVGAGVVEARDYLLQNGVDSVTVLTREDGEIVRRAVPLQ